MKDRILIVGVGAHGCSQKVEELISKLDSCFDVEIVSFHFYWMADIN